MESESIASETLRLEWIDPAELQSNPANWRRHPAKQKLALKAAIAEVGWAGALLYNERTQRLIDGHARKEEFAGQPVPVLIGSWDEATEKKILATLDPLAAMAEADKDSLDKLLREVQTGDEDLANMLTELAEKTALLPDLNEPRQNGEQTDDEELVEEDHEEDDLDLLFKAPYPWFGGKSRVASMVWRRFGDIKGYIEPFFGSGAVFLNRPQPFEGTETVNDFDGMVSNFWRAVQADPEAVAKHADWPVFENDANARHAWLVERKDSLQAKLEGDPDYFDAKIAGWWVWGMACWIGGRFCSGEGPWRVVTAEDGSRQLVHLRDAGQGVNRQLVHLRDAGQGVNRQLVHLRDAGQGVNRKRVKLGGGFGGSIGGMVSNKVQNADPESGGTPGLGECGLLAWMQALSERLRRVRVCCGDWTRICGGKSGDAISHFFGTGEPCGVFLDPPYAAEANRTDEIYAKEDLQVAHAVREWAIAHGDDPRLRIALCGYEGEHQMPATWRKVAWKAHGGMAFIGKKSQGQENKFRERVWFSPHCLTPEADA